MLDSLVFDCLLGLEFCRANHVVINAGEIFVAFGKTPERSSLKSVVSLVLEPLTEYVVEAAGWIEKGHYIVMCSAKSVPQQ